jgi:hypothetical protein
MLPVHGGAGPGAGRQRGQRRAGHDRHRGAASPQVRRLPLGNLLFKLGGRADGHSAAGPGVHVLLQQYVVPEVHQQVVLFHLGFNLVLACSSSAFTGPVARLVERCCPAGQRRRPAHRPRHLDPVALATPSLAISCAAREALHQADVVETMLRGVLPVMRDNDLELAERLRQMDDTVDELYSAIKFYLTQISREALSEREGRRWTDIVSFTINMEQIGDMHRARAAGHRGQEDPQGPQLLRGRHGRDLPPARAAAGQPAPGHERVPRRPCARRAEAAGGEGALPRPGARIRRQPHRAAAGQHRAEHRDQLAAPGPDQRAQAHQLAHLLDRLPHPRIGRCAGGDPAAPLAACAEPQGCSQRAARARRAAGPNARRCAR